MINPSFLFPIYIWGMFLLSLFYSIKIYNFDNKRLLQNQNNIIPAILLFIIATFLLGLRDIDGGFGDTIVYAWQYYNYTENPSIAYYELIKSNGNETFFPLLIIALTPLNDASLFFLIVELLYIGLTLWACYRLFPNNPYAAFLITLASFSFFSYGTNGIRNGLGCAFILLAISFIRGNIWHKLLAFGLCIIAINFHRSTFLPFFTLFASVFIVKNFRFVLAFWVLSILISNVWGSTAINFFDSLGFDDRFSSYAQGASDKESMLAKFSHIGFRWDFLLYSSVPILIGSYVVIYKKLKDEMYNIILNTYTLANAFWIMVINASYSNRFAYLSWFMYSIVLAYPFLKLNVWKNQSHKVGLMMILQVLFTIIV